MGIADRWTWTAAITQELTLRTPFGLKVACSIQEQQIRFFTKLKSKINNMQYIVLFYFMN